MNEASERPMLIYMIYGYAASLENRGIDFPLPSRAELLEMDMHDLQKLERRLRDLARTPSGI